MFRGSFNARDLGGIKTRADAVIRRGAVVRSDGLDKLEPSGWDDVRAHGVRTIIDLRNADERVHAPAPTGITIVSLPLDGIEDREFWDPVMSDWSCGTPLYYAPHVARFPTRSGRVLRAIAEAEPGGVLYHCAAGRDRTGLITLLLLALLDVAVEYIIADYMQSRERLVGLWASRGETDQGPEIDRFLENHGTSLPEAVRAAHDAMDLEVWRSAAGFGEREIMLLRARLL